MKSFRKKMGKSFVAGGWGKSGPYLVATHRLANRTYAKATTGTRGTTVGVKQRIGRRNYEIGYNLTTKSAYLRQSRARRRSRRQSRSNLSILAKNQIDWEAGKIVRKEGSEQIRYCSR